MGASNSKVLFSELAWEVNKDPVKATLLYIDDAKTVKIICPIQDGKDKTISIKDIDGDGFIPLSDIFQAIYKVYKPIKQDHIFFEGLEPLQSKGKTIIYKLRLGS